MLKLLKTFHGNVIGVSAEGTVTDTDYETTLIPAVEKALESHSKIRLLYYLGSEFKGFDFSALADDVRLSLRNLTNWEKVAMVSDNTVLNSLVKFFEFSIPGEIRVFRDRELEEAKAWIIRD